MAAVLADEFFVATAKRNARVKRALEGIDATRFIGIMRSALLTYLLLTVHHLLLTLLAVHCCSLLATYYLLLTDDYILLTTDY